MIIDLICLILHHGFSGPERGKDELNRWTSSSKNKNEAKFQTSHAVCILSTLINPKSHQTRAKFKCINIKNFDTFFYPFPQAWMKLYPQRLLIFLALKRYIFLLIGMDDTFPNKNPHIPEFGKVQRRVWSALYTPTIITRVYFTNNIIYLCLLLDLHEQLPCISFIKLCFPLKLKKNALFLSLYFT